MEGGVPARLTAAQGRKFGVTVGLAFGVIGALLIWRHHPGRATIAFSLAGALILSGLLVPTLLGPVERAWMGLAHLISKVTTPIFMGIVYFILITPIGMVRKLAGKSMTSARTRGASNWTAHTPVEADRMERQF